MALSQEFSDSKLNPSSKEVNLLKRNEDIDYIAQLVSASPELKKQNYSTPLFNNQLISNYCVTTGSTVFYKESLLDNVTTSVWSQMKFPSEKWRISVFLSYLKKFQNRFLIKDSNDNYYSIDHGALLEDLTKIDDSDMLKVLNRSINILNEKHQISDVFHLRFNALIEADKNSKNDYFSNFSGFLAGNYLCSELLSSVA